MNRDKIDDWVEPLDWFLWMGYCSTRRRASPRARKYFRLGCLALVTIIVGVFYTSWLMATVGLGAYGIAGYYYGKQAFRS